MKRKTSGLNGAALEWAVAASEGYSGWDGECFTRYSDGYPGAYFLSTFKPGSDWSHGGPIIERERMAIFIHSGEWAAQLPGSLMLYGPTPLIAAMRCFVASKLGEEVEIPGELL